MNATASPSGKPQSDASKHLIAIAYLLLIAILGALLGPCLIGEERLAFRDVSHFYTPLYAYVSQRQAEAWLPMWNPHDLNGLPLAGETTTALFYPIRILIYKLIAAPSTAIAWYVTFHLILCAVTVHIAARSAGANRFGTAIAILAYPLSGPIFFLIYNPPFLVGASWLPLAIAGGIAMLRNPTCLWITVVAVSLAMPILGGDPQSSFHVLLFGMVVTLSAVMRRWKDHRDSILKQIGTMTIPIVLAALMSAPQLAASIDWGLQSSRFHSHINAEQFDFSVTPWRWCEFFVAEASGRLFPINTRLPQLIPLEERTWVVTLYAGIIPIVLLFDRYLKKGCCKHYWDSLILIGLLFSLVTPYWILTQIVPGYDAFRYPAKWLPFASLGIAITAAKHASYWSTCGSRTANHICLTVGFVTFVIAVVCTIAASTLTENAFHNEIQDRFWGPLQINSGLQIITWSSLVATGFVITFALLGRAIKYPVNLKASCFVILLVASDLYFSVRAQVAVVNTQDESALLLAMQDKQLGHGDTRSMRWISSDAWPEAWKAKSNDKSRLLEVEVSQRATSFGRWHLLEQGSTFNSIVSIKPQRFETFWEATALLPMSDAMQSQLAWNRIQHWLGVNEEIHALSINAKMQEQPIDLITGQRRVAKMPGEIYSWDSEWKAIQSLDGPNVSEMTTRLKEVAFEDSHGVPLVEGGNASLARPTNVRQNIKVLHRSPERHDLFIATEAPGLLTLKVFQDGNWKATLASNAQNDRVVLRPRRTDGLFMSIEVPPGTWEIAWTYEPRWLFASLAMMTIGWLAAVTMICQACWLMSTCETPSR